MTSSWTTSKPGTDALTPSLIERAKKREVFEGGTENCYVVIGNGSLGDSYPSYLVQITPDANLCDCLSLNRTGGHYRKTCSHITGALLFQQEHGPWGSNPREDHFPPIGKEKDRAEVEDSEGESERGNVEPTSDESSTTNKHSKRMEIDVDASEKEIVDAYGGLAASMLARKPVPPVIDDFPLWDLDDTDLWDDLQADTPLPRAVRVSADDPPLPEKFTEYRDSQWEAVMEIEQALEDGYKAIFVSAPTGSGKTLIAESVRRFRGTRALYTCTTKVLQNQILEEFEYAKVIKGRSNYRTFDNLNDLELSALDCTKKKAILPACQKCPGWQGGDSWKGTVDLADPTDAFETFHCSWCHPVYECPYEIAKREAILARLAVLNTAYFLAETNYVDNSRFKGKEMVLIDEADMLEAELMRFIEVNITARDRKMLGIGLPEKKSVSESWVEWIVDEVIPAIKKKRGTVDLSPDLFGSPDVKEIRKGKKLDQLIRKVKMLIQEEEDSETGEMIQTLNDDWIYTGYEKNWQGEYPPDEKVKVTFKPIHVKDYARKFLWSRGKQFVLLSATFVSPAMEAEFLGLESEEWTVVEIPSTFPVLQRPIIPRMVANVVTKNMSEATSLLIEELAKIMDEHPDERILVHSVSYKLTKDLFFELRKFGYANRLSTYFHAGERSQALDKYLSNPRGVLIAPSFDRGVDLPADDCRVVVVAKIPYLSLGDKQVKTRLYGTGREGKTWYAVQAIRSLIQMTGRGMRSADDSCRTYILDKQFMTLYNRNRRLFPKWWAEAIVWDLNDPKWREMA